MTTKSPDFLKLSSNRRWLRRQEQRRRRSRRLLLMVTCCILLGVVFVPIILRAVGIDLAF